MSGTSLSEHQRPPSARAVRISWRTMRRRIGAPARLPDPSHVRSGQGGAGAGASLGAAIGCQVCPAVVGARVGGAVAARSRARGQLSSIPPIACQPPLPSPRARDMARARRQTHARRTRSSRRTCSAQTRPCTCSTARARRMHCRTRLSTPRCPRTPPRPGRGWRTGPRAFCRCSGAWRRASTRPLRARKRRGGARGLGLRRVRGRVGGPVSPRPHASS